MKKIKKLFIDFIKNPGKVFLVAALIHISSLALSQIFKSIGLPEIANESNGLSDNQILIGFLLSLIRIILSIFSIIFDFLFTFSLFYLVYRIVKPKINRSK